MVQKRSKSGFNTGNTLRLGYGRYLLAMCMTPVLRFQFRRQDIEDKMDALCLDPLTHSDDQLAQYQCLALLDEVCATHECLQVEDDAVSYSLGKKGRWETIERLRSIIEKPFISWKEAGLRVRFVEENGAWKKRVQESCFGCDDVPEEDGGRKGTVGNLHFRGIQRKMDSPGWKRSKEKKKRHLETYPVAIEYSLIQNSCFAEAFSRSPPSAEEFERGSKKNARSVKSKKRAVLEYPECQELKGVSASKYVDHIYGNDLKYKTRYGKKRRQIDSNITLVDRYARENAEAEGDDLNTKLFITEVEVKSTKKLLESKTWRKKPGNERVSLWQFIEENLLSRESHNTEKFVTFTNCKNGNNCSRRKLRFDISATEQPSLGSLKRPLRRSNEEKEKSPPDAERSRKKVKKQKGANANGVNSDYQSLEIPPIILKLKSSNVDPQKIRSTYGSDYRESTTPCPRTFWINLSKTILPDKVTTSSETDEVLDYLTEFSLLLLFHEISTSRRLPSSSSTDEIAGKKSLKLFTLHLKINVVESEELLDIAKQIQEAFAVDDRIFTISEVVSKMEVIFRTVLHGRKDGKDLLSSLFRPPPPPPPSIPPSHSSLSNRWDWIYEMQNWNMKIYSQHKAVSALLKEKCSSLRRPLSAGDPLSRPNSIARQNRDLRLIQNSILNFSTPCSVCGSRPSVTPPPSLLPSVRPSSLPLLIPSDRQSPSSSPLTVSGGNWMFINPCGHSFCPRCWTRIVASKLNKRLALDKCPVSDVSECQSDIDPVALLLSLPLRCFQRHLFNLSTIQLSRHPLWQWCPNDRCSRAVQLSAACILRRSVVVRCECGARWCFHCRYEGHWPASCADAKLFRHYLHQEGIEQVPTTYSVMRSMCLFCQENSADYGINQRSVSVTELSKDGLAHHLGLPNGLVNRLPNKSLAQSTNGLSNKLSTGTATESINDITNGLLKKLTTSDLSQSWSNHSKLPRIGAVHRENRLTTAQTSHKSGQAQRSLLKQDVVLKNNVTLALSSDVTTHVTCSCSDEICIKCLKLDGNAFQLPATFSVERQQPLVSLRCSSVVPLLFYRSSINHRSMKMLWSTAAAEVRATQLARKLMNKRQLLHRNLLPGTKGLAIIPQSLSIETGKVIQPPLERLNRNQKSNLAMPPKKIPPRSRLDSFMEADMFLLVSVQQFAHQVHAILENVYVVFCFDPFSEKTSTVLQHVVQLEKILSTLEMVTEEADDKVTALPMPKLVKAYERGQEFLRIISKHCSDF